VSTYTVWIICERYDGVYKPAPLTRNQVARCVRCAAVLDRGSRLSLQQHLALTIGAGLLFVLANAFPVISISLQDLTHQATL